MLRILHEFFLSLSPFFPLFDTKPVIGCYSQVLQSHRMGISLQAGGVPHGHSHGGVSHSHDQESGHSHDQESGHSHDQETSHRNGSPHSHGKGRENINVRAAFIHVLGDFLQSVGVFAAALVIYFFPNMGYIDPICTFLFSILVLVTTFNIIKDVLNVFMEGKGVSFGGIFWWYLLMVFFGNNFPIFLLPKNVSLVYCLFDRLGFHN